MKNKDQIRQCISCRTQLPREGFIRLTKTYDLANGTEKVVVNPDKYQLGRSAYICKKESCITISIKEKKIARMLKISQKAVETVLPELSVLISPSVLKKGVLV